MITLTIMFICTSCTSNLLENDLKKAELKGKVKSIKTTEYNAVERFGELVKDKSGETSIRIYNQEGMIIERSEYFSNGSLNYKLKYSYDEKGNITDESYEDKSYSSKAKYTYDKNGNLIEKSAYDANGDLKGRAKYTYDENGNMIESSLYGSEGSEKAKYSYDKKGNKVEGNYYNLDGKFSGKSKTAYDKKGNIIENSYYYGEELSYKTTFSYDKKGNMTAEETQYSYNEELDYQPYNYRRYVYDEKGHIIEYSIKIEGREEGKLSYDKKGNLIKEIISGSDFYYLCDYKEIIYSYDKKGNMIEKSGNYSWESEFDGKGTSWSKTIYSYDNKGNMIEENVSGYSEGNYYSQIETYSYDKKGNWIEHTRKLSKGKHKITEREIEYY